MADARTEALSSHTMDCKALCGILGRRDSCETRVAEKALALAYRIKVSAQQFCDLGTAGAATEAERAAAWTHQAVKRLIGTEAIPLAEDRVRREGQAVLRELLALLPGMEVGSVKPSKGDSKNVVWDLANRLYRVGDRTQLVTKAEDDALQAFADCPAMDSEALVSATKNPRSPRTLRDMRVKYDGMFAEAIDTPIAKGRGGYRVIVKSPDAPE
jgi:hypothetical protein